MKRVKDKMNNKLSIDKIDIELIKLMTKIDKENKDLKSYQATKNIFPELNNDYELRKKECFLRLRLNRLVLYGIFGKRPEINTFFLNKDKCRLVRGIIYFEFNEVLRLIINLNKLEG